MTKMKFTATDVSKEFVVAVTALSVPVAKAATNAIKNAGELLKYEARQHIHSVGFSYKWENAYKVKVYPEKGNSIDAAAQGLFKGIDYSDIYATGGRITGSNLLWLPFPTTPKVDRRKFMADVRDYKKKGIKMVSFRSKSGTPLLGVPAMVTRSQAKKKNVKFTFSQIQSANFLVTSKAATRAKNTSLVRTTIPLFHGVSTVPVKKKFNWDKVVVKVQLQVPALYEVAIQKLADK